MGRLSILLLTAALLGACSQKSTEQIRGDMQAQSAAQDALRRRLDEFEGRLTDVGGRVAAQEELAGRLAALEARLVDLDQRLGDFDARLGDETQAREGAVAELHVSVRELRRTFEDLGPKVAALQRAAGDLEARLNLLEQRFADHTRHPG